MAESEADPENQKSKKKINEKNIKIGFKWLCILDYIFLVHNYVIYHVKMIYEKRTFFLVMFVFSLLCFVWIFEEIKTAEGPEFKTQMLTA